MKKSRLFSIFIVLAVVGVSIGAYFFYSKRKALEISYREISVARGHLEVTVLGTGTLEPQNRVEIKPPVAGRIEKVLIQEGQTVHKNQVLAWMSSSERAAVLDAARSQGPDEVKKWEEYYKPTPILAPIRGTIILRNVESGQTFTNAESVFVMSDRLTVKAQVDETDIAEIKVGQKAKIVLDAYPKAVTEARVDQIAFDAKTVNNVTTYIVDVLPETTPDFFRSGMTANVTFLVNQKDGVLLVPNDAIRIQDGHYSILVRGQGSGSPTEKPIEVGLTDGKQTEIVKGLAEAEVVLAAEIKAPRGEKPRASSPFSPFAPRHGGGR